MATKFLKALFDAAENGMLTYDAFETACDKAGIKPVNLASGDYVSKNKYSDDLKAKETTIEGLNTTIKDREGDITTLQEKLKEASGDAEKLSTITSELEGLKSKYKADTDNLNARLKQQAKDFAVRDFVGTKKFTSKAAQRDFTNYLMSKDFEVQDGKIMGGEDYVDAYTKDNADAFVIEKRDEQKPTKPQPTFVDQTSGKETLTKTEGEFKFNFTPLYKPKE